LGGSSRRDHGVVLAGTVCPSLGERSAGKLVAAKVSCERTTVDSKKSKSEVRQGWWGGKPHRGGQNKKKGIRRATLMRSSALKKKGMDGEDFAPFDQAHGASGSLGPRSKKSVWGKGPRQGGSSAGGVRAPKTNKERLQATGFSKNKNKYWEIRRSKSI